MQLFDRLCFSSHPSRLDVSPLSLSRLSCDCDAAHLINTRYQPAWAQSIRNQLSRPTKIRGTLAPNNSLILITYSSDHSSVRLLFRMSRFQQIRYGTSVYGHFVLTINSITQPPPFESRDRHRHESQLTSTFWSSRDLFFDFNNRNLFLRFIAIFPWLQLFPRTLSRQVLGGFQNSAKPNRPRLESPVSLVGSSADCATNTIPNIRSTRINCVRYHG